MKNVTKLDQAIIEQKRRLKELRQKRAAANRRHLAKEQRQTELKNQLLGQAVASIATTKFLTTLRGLVCARKAIFVRQVNGQEDESKYKNLLSHIDTLLSEKNASES